MAFLANVLRKQTTPRAWQGVGGLLCASVRSSYATFSLFCNQFALKLCVNWAWVSEVVKATQLRKCLAQFLISHIICRRQIHANFPSGVSVSSYAATLTPIFINVNR